MTAVLEGPRVERARQERAALVPRAFRPDVQGMRALAAMLVVLYHAHVPGLSGGYVGVDVFFVLSGYLITLQLTGRQTTSARTLLSGFYARRLRRLLPPAALVAVVTLLVSWQWASPLQTRALSRDALFTVFYGLNYRLAGQGIDYQQARLPPSALQHYWSLAVEEQFYVVWPLLVVAVAALARRRWRPVLAGLLVVLTAGSLVDSARLLAANQPLAYFSAQSRVWELGAGALLAVGTPLVLRRVAGRRLPCELLAVTGTALLLWSATRFDDRTPFPGLLALVPVGGTVALLLAGTVRATLLERAVWRWRPVQGVGAVSYSWYLWHWPMLVLAPAVLGRSLDRPLQLLVVVVALVLATLTWLLVERPVRWLRWRPSDWLGAGLLVSLTTTTAAVVLGASAVATLAQTAAPRPLELSGALVDPFAGSQVGGPVTPSLLDASALTPSYPASCIAPERATTSPACLIGPDGHPSSAAPTHNRVVLLGDSHAGEFFDPLQQLAARNGWSVEVLNKVGCPLATITTYDPTLHRDYTECDQWRAGVLRRLAAEPVPRLVFFGQLDRYDASPAQLAAGWRTTLAALTTLGAPLVHLDDTPYPGKDVPSCVSGSLSRWSACAFPRATALRPDALPVPVAGHVDMDPWLCPGTGPSCPAVRGGVLLYRDDSHVTRTAAVQLTSIIGQQLVDQHLLPGTVRPLPAVS